MEENDFFYKMLTIIGSIVGGVSLGVIFVAYFLYPKNDKYNNNDENCESERESESNSENGEEDSQEEEEEEYFNKYFDELTDLDERELTPIELENLRLNVLEEETPEGKVIMTYNSDIESFCYYADSKTIAYRNLDTAARLFTITYNCKSICVNYKEEFEKGKENVISQIERDTKKAQEEEEANKTIEQPTEKSIFAKFKSYNTSNKPNNNGSNNGSNNIQKDKKNNSNNSNKKYYIMTEKANKFRYKGTLEDFIKSPASNNDDTTNSETNINTKIDYATFKANYVNQIEKKNN